MRFTLDTNCLIDVEDGRPAAPFVRELVSLHRKNGINVAVSAIGASERQRNGGYAENFASFQEKLTGIGCEALELLPPLAYTDICYWDYCVAADAGDSLEREIHEVLFPNVEYLWSDFANKHAIPLDAHDKKWRNAKCDVLGMWCHIKHGGGVFVTSDDNFHAESKRNRLVAFGAGVIARPQQALAIARGHVAI